MPAYETSQSLSTPASRVTLELMYRSLENRAIRLALQVVVAVLLISGVVWAAATDTDVVVVFSLGAIGLIALIAIKLALVAQVTASGASGATRKLTVETRSGATSLDNRLGEVTTSLDQLVTLTARLDAANRDLESLVTTLSAELPKTTDRVSSLQVEIEAIQTELDTLSRLLQPYATLLDIKEQEVMALREHLGSEPDQRG